MPYKPGRICSIDGCGKPLRARGWCSMHWYRWRYNGDPNVVQVRTRSTAPCAAEGCEKVVWANGLCPKHLSRIKAHGSLDLPPQPTVDERFWSKVDKDGPPHVMSWDGSLLDGPCWLWGGAHNEEGHGLFFPSRRSPIGAHRYSYRQLVGPIAEGLHLDHLCRNPPCVNPAHLDPVTVAENTRRGYVARSKESA